MVPCPSSAACLVGAVSRILWNYRRASDLKQLVTPAGVQQARSIHLETRRGTSILNSQSPVIATWQAAQLSKLQRDYPKVVQRTGPSGFYNCHGLVFASRRTEVYSGEVHKILNEDGYSEVELPSVKPGDVILYFDSDGDIEHSGIVVSAPNPDSLRIPKVVSKWGAWREVIHFANDCPYTFTDARYYRVVE